LRDVAVPVAVHGAWWISEDRQILRESSRTDENKNKNKNENENEDGNGNGNGKGKGNSA
jgi:hypothetical protein